MESSVTDGENRTTTYLTNEFGRQSKITDSAGVINTLTYDGQGNPTGLLLSSEHEITQTFDSMGNLLTSTDETVGGTTSFTYEPNFNRISSVTGPQNKTTNFTYDTKGNLEKIESPLGRSGLLGFNERGLPMTFTDIFGVPGTLGYDSQGNLLTITFGTGEKKRNVSYTYSPEGYIASVTDPMNRTTSYNYDSWGRILNQTRPDGQVIAFTYDENGNLTSLIPPDRPAHQFRYNSMDLETVYDPPNVEFSEDTSQSEYNKDQQLSSLHRPDGKSIGANYHNNGRLGSLTLPRGTVTYEYDEASGQPKTISAPGGITTTYSFKGELLDKETWTGPVSGSVGYTYDSSSRLVAQTINEGAFDFDYL